MQLNQGSSQTDQWQQVLETACSVTRLLTRNLMRAIIMAAISSCLLIRKQKMSTLRSLVPFEHLLSKSSFLALQTAIF